MGSVSVDYSFPADRTDSQGNFFVEFGMSTLFEAEEIHFASPDFLRQAIHVVRIDDPDLPVEIMLRPVRRVRARVIETPKDEPQDNLWWDIYSVDPADGKLYEIPAIGEKGAFWAFGHSEHPNGVRPIGGRRRLEIHLPAGRYKIRFESNTVYRFAYIVAPIGDGPLDLPDIHLETLAWVKMLGKPAAEIDAIDLEGKPVKLADYRGKVVVLAFWSTKNESELHSIPHLTEIQKRFHDQPLAILALHDASLTSLTQYHKALEPLRNRLAGEIPIRFLLDRPPVGKGQGPLPLQSGEDRSGRTADAYEVQVGTPTFVIEPKWQPFAFATVDDWNGGVTTFAIGKDGELVREFEEPQLTDAGLLDRGFAIGLLEAALEDQFGLQKSHPAKPRPGGRKPRPDPNGPLVVKGKVVDLDGNPIAGAVLSTKREFATHAVATKGNLTEGAKPSADAMLLVRTKDATSGPSGDFSFTVDAGQVFSQLTVEGSGLASRVFLFGFGEQGKFPLGRRGFFLIEPTGHIPQPLKMGPGAAVTGRVVRDAKPVEDVVIGLKYGDGVSYNPYEELETKTDGQGAFRIPHVLPQTNYWVYAKLGTLKDHGAVIPERIHTPEQGVAVDLGDLKIQPGRTLAGQVVRPDGKPPQPGCFLLALCPNAPGKLDLKLGQTGRFEFRGLPDGPVSVLVFFPGFRLSAKNKCINPISHNQLEGQLVRDIHDLTILVESGDEPAYSSIGSVDPAAMADFNDAKAGPITGVPPGDYANDH